MTDPKTRLESVLSSRYHIGRELGRGGMATVYLAHDIRHDRDVALKVLHPELGAVIGAERFLAEIKVTARLQHPHILGLIDSGEADGLLFYVMPFVSGESLRVKIQREKQLSIPEALRIATEVAGALNYAHRQGVVHRDIKPENILLHDGQALVADFGIALALTSAGGGRMTQTGMSLGTPHYMSPEQAMGERDITARSDVYALGAMTYEMLTGDPPFTGSTNQAITAKVLTERPIPPRTVRDTIPPHVETAILVALAKLPADRWESTKEFADALSNPALSVGRHVTGIGPAYAGGAPAPVFPSARLAVLVGLATLLLGGAIGWLLRRPAAAGTFPVEFYVEPDSSHTMELGTFVPLALSRDGHRLAYLGRTRQGTMQLFERVLGARDARPLEGTGSADHPFYSYDGEWIAYDDGGFLKKVRVTGGAPVTIARIQGNTTGGAWGPDGTIVFSSGVPRVLFRVSADGGTPEQITTSDTAAVNQVRPSFLPDGKTVLFTAFKNAASASRLGVLSLETKRVKFLDVPALIPKYVMSGEIMYVLEDGSVVAQPFDLGALEFSGTVRQVAEGVSSTARIAPAFDASYTGVIAFRPGSGGATTLVSVDRAGKEKTITSAPDVWSPRFSPTGDRVAFARAGSNAASRDIWVYSIPQASATRITHGSANAVDPYWSPDGKRLVFSSGTAGVVELYTAAADASDSPAPFLQRLGDQYQPVFTRDGRSVLFTETSAGSRGDLYRTSPDSGAPVIPFGTTPFDESAPALSPDGRWVAYNSDESGQYEIYVRAFPGPGPKAVISNGGGREAVWSPSGQEIFYRGAGKLIAAAVETGATVTVRGRTELFENVYIAGRTNRNFDVHPDGNHFLFIKAPAQQRLVVKLNATAPEPR